jgi:hypothetical protein
MADPNDLVNDPNSERFMHPSVTTVVPPPAPPVARTMTADLPLDQRPQVADAGMPQAPAKKKGKGFQVGAPDMPDLNPLGPNVSNVLTLSGQDADAAAAKGEYGQALGAGARGLLATIPAQVADTYNNVTSYAAPLIKGAKGFAAGLFGADATAAPATAPTAPAATAAPSVLPDPNRQQLQAGVNPGNAQTGQPPTPQPAPPPNTVGFDPSITKTVDAQGRTTYTNIGTDPAFANRGAVTPQNEAAANTLATRYAATPAAAPGSAAPIVLPDTGGYGLRDKGFLAAREQRMDLESRMRGLSADQAATLAERSKAASDQNATSRANNAETVAAHREATAASAGTAAAQIAANAPHLAAETQHARAQAQLTGSQVQAANLLQQAKIEYGKALASGDEKAADKAKDNLRAAQGKWEKEVPDHNRIVVVPGGTIPDPNNLGQYIHQPSGVFDQEEKKFYSMPAQQGNVPAPKFDTGKTYVDPTSGEKRKWDGSKFIPV